MGATIIKADNIFKTRVFMPSKKLSKKVFFSKPDKQVPNKSAKNITCNIFPSVSDLNGLSGIIFKITLKKVGASFILID